VQFIGPGARRSNDLLHRATADETIGDGHPPLFEDVPAMLDGFESGLERSFERSLPPTSELGEQVHDDGVHVPVATPELQFGHAMAALMFGGKLQVAASATHTLTWNDPVVTDWDQVGGLVFDEDNDWVQRTLGCLDYFVKHASKPFAIQQFQVIEGANFVVSMRGTTQAFYDLGEQPAGLRNLYELGYRSGVRLFQLRRGVIKEHNERVLGHQAFADLSYLHSVPWLDTDAYALCSPRVFGGLGAEYKQKILSRFGGGKLYIHGLGRHIVPIAGRLNDLTQLSLYDDPKCPPYFAIRDQVRTETFDIPLTMDCDLRELLDGLADHSLPGGILYSVFLPEPTAAGELNRLMDRVREYRAGRLSARPKPAV
jgi:hypothetical protein